MILVVNLSQRTCKLLSKNFVIDWPDRHTDFSDMAFALHNLVVLDEAAFVSKTTRLGRVLEHAPLPATTAAATYLNFHIISNAKDIVKGYALGVNARKGLFVTAPDKVDAKNAILETLDGFINNPATIQPEINLLAGTHWAVQDGQLPVLSLIKSVVDKATHDRLGHGDIEPVFTQGAFAGALKALDKYVASVAPENTPAYVFSK